MYNATWTIKNEKPQLKMLTKNGIIYKDFPFSPYFYVENKKIEVTLPTDIKNENNYHMHQGYKTFEADVKFVNRYMIDTNQKCEIPEKYLIYDIEVEVDPSGIFPDPQIAKNRITCICAIGSDGKKFTICDDNEKKMLMDFITIVNDYRITGGWNTSRFDLPYIKNRMIRNKIKYDFFNIVDIDLLAAYKFASPGEKESFSLNNVAIQEGIGKKYDFKGTIHELSAMFHTNRDELIKYCMIDAELTIAIEKKYKLINMFFGVANKCYCFPSQFFFKDFNDMPQVSITVALESLCLKKAKELNIKLPSKTNNVQSPFKGGLVIEPKKTGVIKNVALLDFTSLFPNIMRTFNIGENTFIEDGSGDIKAPIGSFDSNKKSYVVEAINELMNEKNRLGIEKLKVKKDTPEHNSLIWQYDATKIVINSLFGITGYYKSSLYKRECCQNVQLIARDVLAFTAKVADNYDCKMIYGDIDSIFIEVDNVEKAIEIADDISRDVNKYMLKNGAIKKGHFEITLDKFFSKLLLLKKKKYVGRVTYDGGPCKYTYLKGLEAKRMDSPRAVREFQKDLIDMMIGDEDVETKELWKYINTYRKKFIKGEFDQQMVVFKNVKKPIDEYENLPPHIRVAKRMEDDGIKVRVGDKIPYIKFGKNKEDVIFCKDGIAPKLRIEWRSFLWDKTFEAIIKRLHLSRNKTLSDFL